MKVRFGILGAGNISGRFARVLGGASGARLEAVAARDLRRAQAFAFQHGAPRCYDSYDALIEDGEIDAVYIGLTHNLHGEMARKCIERGKAVLCEKPFVLAGAEALALTQLARERHVLLMEGMWTRCIPAFRRAREWVASGAIGEARLVEASFCFSAAYDPAGRLWDPALAGGALYDAGVYPIEFATGILGENPDAVGGAAVFAPTGVDAFDAVSLRFPGGAVASLSCGITAAASTDAVVYGTGGRVEVYDFLRPKRCALFDAEGRCVDRFEQDFEDGFIYEIEHFSDLLQAGRIESDRIPWADTVACAGVFDRMRAIWERQKGLRTEGIG